MSFCSFSGGEFYKDLFETGMYVCAKCGHELFSSRSKYEHSSPWPAQQCVKCGKCGNGLGHEFVNDGPKHGLSRF
uniref:Methionine sulfoxide reductase B1a n=1 Tax=Sinocyclocheilus anshuiensis TaxID=1608454 RepID=A0A671M0Q8_9TELE